MILSELKGYFSERRRAPLADVVNRFGVSSDAARGMLDVWVHKGRVRRLDSEACGGCCGCGEGQPEIYEWLDDRGSRA